MLFDFSCSLLLVNYILVIQTKAYRQAQNRNPTETNFRNSPPPFLLNIPHLAGLRSVNELY
jgi:hypothetical protein